jgi:hypothetical protein
VTESQCERRKTERERNIRKDKGREKGRKGKTDSGREERVEIKS